MPTPVPAIEPVQRQCSRCRGHFPAEPGLHAAAIREWWVCAPCHDSLFPTKGSS